MSSTDVLLLVLAAALVPTAGLLAAADAAITTVSPARVDEMDREGRRGAAALRTITLDRPRYTNLLLLLRTGAEITATLMVAKVALSTWGFQMWVGLVLVVIMVVTTYVAIGVLPRTLGRQHPYAVGLALAGPTRGLATVLAPVASVLILVGNAITPGRGFREGPFSSDIELRELVDIAGSRGVVEETEREMLQSVFDLGDTIVREVMVPRTEVVWIEREKSLRQALQLATRSGFSRIPVVGQDVDDVVGIAYIKDMIASALTLDPGDLGPGLAEVMRDPVFVPESKNVDALLREMQRDRTHFAIVVDEYGGSAGIVTIEDLLEEIVGEITDEYDAETPAPYEELPDGSYRVSARLPVEDLGELFHVELPDDEVDTVGGLLAQLLGRVPLPGSQARVATLDLLGEPGVDRRGRPRVQTLIVRRLSPAELADHPSIEDTDGAAGVPGGSADQPAAQRGAAGRTDPAPRSDKEGGAADRESARRKGSSPATVGSGDRTAPVKKGKPKSPKGKGKATPDKPPVQPAGGGQSGGSPADGSPAGRQVSDDAPPRPAGNGASTSVLPARGPAQVREPPVTVWPADLPAAPLPPPAPAQNGTPG